MYPGSLAADIQRKINGRRTRVTEMILRDVVSEGHADGRKRYSETDRSRKKNIYTLLAHQTS